MKFLIGLTFVIDLMQTQGSIKITQREFFEARTNFLEKYANILRMLPIHIIKPESVHTGMQLAAQEAMKKKKAMARIYTEGS